ncbi:MAG: SPOR domain-containing protein, partial [Bacteroidaceae bacterium]|nr:SPOR domain-containing protein [Bacteroidaceae bacterium]
AGQQSEAVDIAPVASTTTDPVDTTYRTEKVVLSSGAEGSLKAFSVVCGSYSRKEGAENIRQTLVDEGYTAIVVQNPSTGLYRVVCASCDTKEAAAVARDKFKAAHPGNVDFQKAWLLYNK